MNKIHLNKYDIEVLDNGCGPSWLLDYLPDFLVSALEDYKDQIFEECCEDHDVDFFFGGTRREFNIANKKFYKCMKNVIKKKGSWYSRWWFYYKAYQYYKLVAKFGWSSFNSKDIRDLEDLPSFNPSKSQEVTQRCVWIDSRWWTRDEAERLGLL